MVSSRRRIVSSPSRTKQFSQKLNDSSRMSLVEPRLSGIPQDPLSVPKIERPVSRNPIFQRTSARSLAYGGHRKDLLVGKPGATF